MSLSSIDTVAGSRCIRGLALLAFGAGLSAAPVAVNSASAVIVGSPNFQQYCNRTHRPSRAVWVFQRNRWECAKITGRFSRLYYRINYALACRITHGTYRFRAYGQRVLCDRPGNVTVRPGGRRTGRLVSPNLRAYCLRYFRTREVNFHYRRNRFVCTQRGNYTLRHFIINMRAACSYTRRTSRVTYIGRDPRQPRCVI